MIRIEDERTAMNHKERKQLVHLIRMRDMKVKRLETYRGTESSKSFLMADISALNFAIAVVEGLQIPKEEA